MVVGGGRGVVKFVDGGGGNEECTGEAEENTVVEVFSQWEVRRVISASSCCVVRVG